VPSFLCQQGLKVRVDLGGGEPHVFTQAWLIGLQGIKVNKGSKDQVFYLPPTPPPSPGDQELRLPEGEVAGTWGR